MKRLISLLVAVLALTSFTLSAGNDKPITYEQLPQKARTLLETHFASEKVAFLKMESKLFKTEYKVMLVSGNEIEFDGKGVWKEIDCEYTAVPLALIPQEIRQSVKERFPMQTIVKIERDAKKYEVELDNEIELKYNLKFQLIDIDR